NNIYIMNAEGTEINRVTKDNSTASYSGLSWSPDGDKLVFNLWDVTPYGGYFPQGISMLILNNYTLTELIVNPYNAVCCAKWSPDGKYIVYSVLGEKSENIYIMNTKNNVSVALTNDILFY